MATITYGVMDDVGRLVFTGMEAEHDARIVCDKLSAKGHDCKVIAINTTVEYVEL